MIFALLNSHRLKGWKTLPEFFLFSLLIRQSITVCLSLELIQRGCLLLLTPGSFLSLPPGDNDAVQDGEDIFAGVGGEMASKKGFVAGMHQGQ